MLFNNTASSHFRSVRKDVNTALCCLGPALASVLALWPNFGAGTVWMRLYVSRMDGQTSALVLKGYMQAQVAGVFISCL